MTSGIEAQILELTAVHKGLANIRSSGSDVVVSGALPFDASADGLDAIVDQFQIEVRIPSDYPRKLPRVWETGGRIGPTDHRNPDGTLCLAVPVEQRRIFLEHPTLLGFTNRLVIPYLYGFSFWRTHGRYPFGEAAHGNEGIVRYYIDKLGLDGEVAALATITSLLVYGYRGHHDCPCGSGCPVRGCHGAALSNLYAAHTNETLRADFEAILAECLARTKDGRLTIPIQLRRQVNRIRKPG